MKSRETKVIYLAKIDSINIAPSESWTLHARAHNDDARGPVRRISVG